MFTSSRNPWSSPLSRVLHCCFPIHRSSITKLHCISILFNLYSFTKRLWWLQKSVLSFSTLNTSHPTRGPLIAAGLSQCKCWREPRPLRFQVVLQVIAIVNQPFSSTTPWHIFLLKTNSRSIPVLQLCIFKRYSWWCIGRKYRLGKEVPIMKCSNPKKPFDKINARQHAY